MKHRVIGQFDNKNLLEGMDYDMGGAFVKTESGNKYVWPWDWVLKDDDTGFFVVIKDDQYQKQFLNNKTTIMDSNANTARELTFGEKATGITFNPGGHEAVNSIKAKFAEIIDELNNLRSAATSGEAKRYYSKAISYAEDSQMNGVKAATWQY